MNRARIAAARAKMHEALDEFFDALEGHEEAANDERPTAPSPRRKVPRPYPQPLNPVSDTDRMRARQMLRRRGIVG